MHYHTEKKNGSGTWRAVCGVYDQNMCDFIYKLYML